MQALTAVPRAGAALRLVATAAAALGLAGCSSGSDSPAVDSRAWTISGTVSGDASSGVSVRLVGKSGSVTTDASGHYKLGVFQPGTFTVAASLDGYTFAPSSRTVTVSTADVPGQDFTATANPPAPDTYRIGGVVEGDAVEGVTITIEGPLPGGASATTTTDADGGFGFAGVVDGRYLVTPSLAGGYLFFPANSLVTVSGRDVVGPDFLSTAPPRVVSGTISGALTSGVTVVLSGDADATVVTGASGDYVFDGLKDGNYTVTPTPPAGYVFLPDSLDVKVDGADATGQDFVAAAIHRIAGTVTGAVAAGVTVTLSGDASGEVVTDGTGTYEFTGLIDGDYVVTPSLDGFDFAPASQAVTLAGADRDGTDFVATPVATWAVTGAIAGAIQGGVEVLLWDLLRDTTATTTTGAGGGFTLTGLRDGSYMVVPVLAGYAFDPASRTFTVTGGDVAGQDFTSAVQPP